MQHFLIPSQYVKMLVFYCKEFLFLKHFTHNIGSTLALLIRIKYVRYENSCMPVDQISNLVTKTLSAVGLKVTLHFGYY